MGAGWGTSTGFYEAGSISDHRSGSGSSGIDDRPARPFGEERHSVFRGEIARSREEIEELFDEVETEAKMEEKGDSEDKAEVEVLEEKSDSEDKGETEEGRTPNQLTEVRGPTRREREEHEATHIPYRSWCEHCVKGRGRKRAHKRKKEQEKEEKLAHVTKVCIDF